MATDISAKRVFLYIFWMAIWSSNVLFQSYSRSTTLKYELPTNPSFTNPKPIGETTQENTRCFDWNDTKESDDWWSLHPDWEASVMDEHQACFRRIEDEKKAKLFKDLHSSQNSASKCGSVVTRFMPSSGMSRDITEAAQGLYYGLTNNRPFQISLPSGEKWHFAAFKEEHRKGRKAVCPSGDMFCYFLPLGVCAPNTTVTDIGNLFGDDNFLSKKHWYVEYAMRPQLWLRHRIQQIVAETTKNREHEENRKCATIHVRRGDVVLHGSSARKYFPMESYLNRLKEGHPDVKDIWLFTDDANAIEEAHKFHPEYNWMYIKKPRHKGSEGGWENHIASDTPDKEVVAMLTEFHLAKECDILVRGASGYADFISFSMRSTGRNISHVDMTLHDSMVFGESNQKSEDSLRDFLQQKMLQENGTVAGRAES